MAKAILKELAEFGQSIWLDDISRPMIEDGLLKKMIGLGLRGMTSNPSLFEKAIRNSPVYNKQIEQFCGQGRDAALLYGALTIRDIEEAADLFFSVYQETKGLDGYVSLEINPELSYKSQESAQEVKRLHEILRRPNVMFKIAATKQGFPAITECVAHGININITLIFSLEQYLDTAQAYIQGMKRLLDAGGDPSRVRSVASVFVSRIDTAADSLLDRSAKPALKSLKGKAAAANSAVIYKKYREIFFSGEFEELKRHGVHIQRVLWGSTSTKNPDYPDLKYVAELMAPDTVNTVPSSTLEALLDHGEVREALTGDCFRSGKKVLEKLREAKIDIDQICGRLLTEGVTAFEKSYQSLLNALNEKMSALCPR